MALYLFLHVSISLSRFFVLELLVVAPLDLDLWLVVGVLAFWLNFVPNVGSAVLQPVERALHPV